MAAASSSGVPPRHTRDDPKDKKTATCQCAAMCGEELPADHIGVCCPAGHILCDDCGAQFVQMTMQELDAASFPPKCSLCTTEIVRPGFITFWPKLSEALAGPSSQLRVSLGRTEVLGHGGRGALGSAPHGHAPEPLDCVN